MPKRAPRFGGAAILVGIVALVGVLAAPGSLAFWQQQTSAQGVTLTVGSAGLRIDRTATSSVPAVYPGAALPIDAASPPTVVNTGDAPIAITLTAAAPTPLASAPSSSDLALAAELRLSAWLAPASAAVAGGCATAPSGAVIWAAHPGGGDPGTATALGTVPAGATLTLCITVGLPGTASATILDASPSGVTTAVTVHGRQVST